MKPDAPRRRNHALWIGPLITIAGAISYFLVFARFATLRDFPWVNLPLVLLGLGLSVLGLIRAYGRSGAYRGKVLGPAGLLASALVSGLFVFYVFGLSYWLPAPTATSDGLTLAPGFTLTAADGHSVSLEDYRGRKVVLTFYRGFW